MAAQRKGQLLWVSPALELSASPNSTLGACQAVPTAPWADPALSTCSGQEAGCTPTDHRELSSGHRMKWPWLEVAMWLCGLGTLGRPNAHHSQSLLCHSHPGHCSEDSPLTFPVWIFQQFSDSGPSSHPLKRLSLTIFRAHWVLALKSFSLGESEWHNLACNYTSSHFAPVLQRVPTVLPRPDRKCPEGKECHPILCDATKHKAEQTVGTQ